MKKEISLSDIVKAMLKNLWLIVILTLVFAIVAFTYTTFFVTPKYTSNTKLYVRNIKDGSLTTNDINLSRNLINAYIEVLLGNKVLDAVAQELNQLKGTPGYEYLKSEGYSRGYIRSSIRATAGEESEIITINVTTTNPKEAKLINDFLFVHLKGEVKNVINTGEPKQIYDPTEPTSPSSPNVSKKTITGAFIGFVIAAAIIMMIYMMDTAVHDENDLSENFDDITILGVIPLIHTKDAQVYSNTNIKKHKAGGDKA